MSLRRGGWGGIMGRGRRLKIAIKWGDFLFLNKVYFKLNIYFSYFLYPNVGFYQNFIRILYGFYLGLLGLMCEYYIL